MVVRAKTRKISNFDKLFKRQRDWMLNDFVSDDAISKYGLGVKQFDQGGIDLQRNITNEVSQT